MEKKENLCISQKSDRRSLSNESVLREELLHVGIFGKMNPVDLLIVRESFGIFAISFAKKMFFILLLWLRTVSEKISLFEYVFACCLWLAYELLISFEGGSSGIKRVVWYVHSIFCKKEEGLRNQIRQTFGFSDGKDTFLLVTDSFLLMWYKFGDDFAVWLSTLLFKCNVFWVWSESCRVDVRKVMLISNLRKNDFIIYLHNWI